MASKNALDDAFALLQVAAKMEKNKDSRISRIEAATKYYEAVYIMKRYIMRLPMTPQQQQTRQLLKDKIIHYECLASKLLESGNSVGITSGLSDFRSVFSDPRSPIFSDPRSPAASRGFFNEESSVIPLTAPNLQSPRCTSSFFVNERSSQANIKLSHALDLDERGETKAAIKVYMEAAELFLKALKADEKLKNAGKPSSNNSNKINDVAYVLSRRLESTIARVEQLKNPGFTQLKSWDECHRKKYAIEQKPSSPLSPEEIFVLKRSSVIASGLFMPWSEEDATKLSHSVCGMPTNPLLWTDPDGLLPLCDKQKQSFHKWARPFEIVKTRQLVTGTNSLKINRGAQKDRKNPSILFRPISPYNIRQNAVTDCSFIASLCICAAFERRFNKRIITSILHPQNEDGTLAFNPQGKYMVKLWLNGVARQVFVDDRLPIDQYGNFLCAYTKYPGNEVELWASIIEKAYMKLCGGYTFPGSNSGVDLFSLTGWIPERIVFAKDPNKIRDFETHPERAWERLFSASSYGDCLITMSSETKLSEEEADKLGLYSGHAYAVLGVIQTSGVRLLQMKNPWANKGWKGRYSSRDLNSWSNKGFCAEVGYNPEIAARHDDGVFFICWEDVLKYFQNIHMSWNPALFQHHITTHGFWPKSQGPIDDTFNCGDNPQYLIKLSERALKMGATLWILISRHVTKQEQEGSEPTDFLTVHLHRNSGNNDRIWYSGAKSCILTGAYTNNPHNLVRYDIKSAADETLNIVLSQYEKKNDLGYTLSCFCTETFILRRPNKDLGFVQEFSSSWTTATAGGPIGTQAFFRNPMYAVALPIGGAIVQLRCSASKPLAVNVMLIPVAKYGDRVNKINSEPPVDSGNYRHGFVVTERVKIPAGYYTLIVSSYSKGQTGLYNIKVFSAVKLKVNPIF